MDPCLLFPVWLFLEHLTAIIDFGSHTRQAQRVPERHLVPGEYRSAEVFLQRGNHSDRAKSIPGDENTFHIGGCMLAYRFVDFGRIHVRTQVRMGNLTCRRQMTSMNDLES